eukprot:3341452-Pleurochrysis_carterae.AAC.1
MSYAYALRRTGLQTVDCRHCTRKRNSSLEFAPSKRDQQARFTQAAISNLSLALGKLTWSVYANSHADKELIYLNYFYTAASARPRER